MSSYASASYVPDSYDLYALAYAHMPKAIYAPAQISRLAAYVRTAPGATRARVFAHALSGERGERTGSVAYRKKERKKDE